MTDRIESPYQRLGGDEGVFDLVRRFYRQMDTQPGATAIRAMHAGDVDPMVEKLAVFLIGWTGGPQNYRERFGPTIIPLAHQRFAIGPPERDQWLSCMREALRELHVDEDLQETLMGAFFQMAEMCRTDSEDGF